MDKIDTQDGNKLHYKYCDEEFDASLITRLKIIK
jgi:hypothetical protein